MLVKGCQQQQQEASQCSCKLGSAKMIESPQESTLVLRFCLCAVQVLWAEERAEKGLTARQSFVDLGCGNGLLVHILTNEGVS